MLSSVMLGSVPQTVSLSGKQRLPFCQRLGELKASEGNFQTIDRHFLVFFQRMVYNIGTALLTEALILDLLFFLSNGGGIGCHHYICYTAHLCIISTSAFLFLVSLFEVLLKQKCGNRTFFLLYGTIYRYSGLRRMGHV